MIEDPKQPKEIHNFKYKSRRWWNILKNFQKGFNHIIAIDLETTGLQPNQDEILQVGIVKVDAKKRKIEITSQYFKPTGKIPAEASKIHKITSDTVEGAPPSYTASTYIAELCYGKNLIIGYNSHNFDFAFIWETTAKITEDTFTTAFSPSHSIDLFQLLKREIPPSMAKQKLTLSNCFSTFQKEYLINAHDATHDALACIKMMPSMIKYYNLPNGRAKIKKYLKEHPEADCFIMTEQKMSQKQTEYINKDVNPSLP